MNNKMNNKIFYLENYILQQQDLDNYSTLNLYLRNIFHKIHIFIQLLI
ncbi:hypothetical protein pb186bvf_005309 [Paramecium bursaria]